jgi:hypothetical protein
MSHHGRAVLARVAVLLPGLTLFGIRTSCRDNLQQPCQEASRSRNPLGSCATSSSNHIEATDGAAGHVESLVVEERSWRITNIVIDTKN